MCVTKNQFSFLSTKTYGVATQKNRLNETVPLAPKTYVKTDGKGNFYNFTLEKFVYLNLCILQFSGVQDFGIIRFHLFIIY